MHVLTEEWVNKAEGDFVLRRLKSASLGPRPLVGLRRPQGVGGGRHPARSAQGGRFQSADYVRAFVRQKLGLF